MTIRAVRQYLGTVVPVGDNYYAALNCAVFTDGTFCFIPKGVRCPMESVDLLSHQHRGSGQFERTLIVAEEGASVSYLEGCTAPKFDPNQLHAAVVELVALDDADIKYSTVQNWYAGDENRQRRHLQFRDQAGHVRRVSIQKSPGPRLKPDRPLPGNILPAFCWAITRSASSIRWR